MAAPPYQAYGQDIRDRAFEFACQIVHFCDDLMKRGRRDFISKCSIALKEARESLFRLRVPDRCQLGPKGKAAALAAEANELAAIIDAIVRNARRNAL